MARALGEGPTVNDSPSGVTIAAPCKLLLVEDLESVRTTLTN